MRYLLLAITLFIGTRALLADQEVPQRSKETNYLADAIALLPDTIPTPGVTTSGYGTAFSGADREIAGWSVLMIDPSRSRMAASWLSLKLIDVLKAEGWNTSASPLGPSNGDTPVQLFVSAEREGEQILCIATIFASSDGTLRISYSQRKKAKEA